MKIIEARGALKQFRRTVWGHQRTFRTPLNDLKRFVSAVFKEDSSIEQADFVMEQIVFPPRYELPALFARYQIADGWQTDGMAVRAESATESRELLAATLSEWIDFLCIPSPTPFVIYADHDERTRLFSHRTGHLNGPTLSLVAEGFELIDEV